MSLFESDNVTTEKADAMRKFINKQRNSKNLFPVIEMVITAVLLLLWWWFSAAWSAPISSGECLRRVLHFLNRGFCIFAVVNTLIVVIFSLSRLKQPAEQPDLHDQYMSFTSPAATAGEIASPPVKVDEFQDKQIVPITTDAVTVAASPAKENLKSTVESSNTAAVPEFRRVNSAREAVRGGMTDLGLEDSRNYRRSLSERLDRRRRQQRSGKQMENLSSDEFRMTVETFIAARRRTLFQERIAEINV